MRDAGAPSREGRTCDDTKGEGDIKGKEEQRETEAAGGYTDVFSTLVPTQSDELKHHYSGI